MVQDQQQNFGDDMNHNFCRAADPKDERPWCYTTDPNNRFDHCDCLSNRQTVEVRPRTYGFR